MNSSNPEPSRSIWNVPNALSTIRFILAIVVMVQIEYSYYVPAMVCFLIAAATDWIDGYWARKFDQSTKFGRIYDPFVDKIIICGAMIALVAKPASGIAAWVATLVVGRELLITSLRGMVEGQGGDFSAKQLGKWKMVAQCAAVVAALMTLRVSSPAESLVLTRSILVWIAVILTILSGAQYVWIAFRLQTQALQSK